MKQSNVEKVLRSLMEIESTSGNEKELVEFLEILLKDQGFKVVRIPVSETTFDVFATVGTPRVVLQAHIDTVPPFIPFSETKDAILGRGACDTKGSAAAILTAGIESKKKGLTDFGLLFTVEEETSFRGAKAAALFFEGALPYFVIGEPSSLKPITRHFGIRTFVVTAKGRAAHTSRPEKGINAINLIQEASMKLRELKLGEGTLGEIVQISGGIAANIVPAAAQLVFSMRIAPEDKTDYLAQISRLVAPCTVASGESLDPVTGDLDPRLKFVGEGQTVRYCTELAFLRNGCVIGPGDDRLAHSEGEQISKKELSRAVSIYGRILAAFQKRGKL